MEANSACPLTVVFKAASLHSLPTFYSFTEFAFLKICEIQSRFCFTFNVWSAE